MDRNTKLLLLIVALLLLIQLPTTLAAKQNISPPIQQAQITSHTAKDYKATSNADSISKTSSSENYSELSMSSRVMSLIIGWLDVKLWAPIFRLVAVVLLLMFFFSKMNLPLYLKKDSWSERTILAFAIVFTFCASALMGGGQVEGPLKDVALVIIGFYFGASSGSRNTQKPLKGHPESTE